MNNYLKTFINSVFAGFMIFIASLLYIRCIETDLKWLGALLFSVGLLTILIFQFDLFTGKVGYVNNKKDLFKLPTILIGNIIGSLPAFFINSSTNLIENKLQAPWYRVFLLSIICGVLIYISVESFKRDIKWVIILAIPAFILCGGEHCVADVCFLFIEKQFTLDLLWFIPLVIIGNSVGSLVIRQWVDFRDR